MATGFTRTQRILLAFYNHYSTCIGMNSYHYNYKEGIFRKTHPSRYISLLSNLITLLVLPFVIWDSFHLMDGFSVSKLTMIASQVNAFVRAAVIIYTVLTRPRREREVAENGHKMMEVQKVYYKHLPFEPELEKRFTRLFYIKYALMIYNMFITILAFFSSKRQWHWYSYLLMFLYIHVQNIIHVTFFYYFIVLWYTCRCVCYMNVQLVKMLKNLQSTADPITPVQQNNCAKELHCMLWVHGQLADMISKLNRTYHFQMLSIRFTFLVSYVMFGYISSTFLFEYDSPSYIVIFCAVSYVAMGFDMYFVDLTCNMIMEHNYATNQILKSFNELHIQLNAYLNRILDQFALQIVRRPSLIDIYGLFKVDKRLWFSMIASTISYTIVLIQSHIVWHNKGYEYVLNN